jgi:hypothetical protein
VTFHVPQQERNAAQAWREYKADEESLEGLPDTTIALASVVDVLALPPDMAATEARRISGDTAQTLKSFALDLTAATYHCLFLESPRPQQRRLRSPHPDGLGRSSPTWTLPKRCDPRW